MQQEFFLVHVFLKAFLSKKHGRSVCRRHQAGNALFLILIAVALFAALSYAVTQSGRGGGSTTKEQALLNSAQILSYAGAIEQAINRLRLLSGCYNDQYSFDNPVVAGYANATAPADKSCHLFDPLGAALVWQAPPSGAVATAGEQYRFFSRTVHPGGGTSNGPELVMAALVNRDTCLAINNGISQINPGGNPPQNIDATIAPLPFDGEYGNANWIEGPGIVQDRGCMFASGEGHWFYYVLIPDAHSRCINPGVNCVP